MPKGKKRLRDLLGDRLRKQFEHVSSNAEATCQEFQKGDNKQGPDHCKAVEKNLNLIIPDLKKDAEKDSSLNETEIFVLLAAAHLHDIGKIERSDTLGWKSEHGRRGMDIINEQYDRLGLDRVQAAAVGLIVGVHGNGRLDELPLKPMLVGTDEVHLIELATVFRLADMLDTTYQRTPEVIARILFPDGNVPDKWKARQAISGWTLDERDRIVLQALPALDEVRLAYALKDMMNEDLAEIAPHLRLGGYPWELAELDIGTTRLPSIPIQHARQGRPFPGMAYYTEDQASVFKGRDEETERLIAVISNSPISLLIGESGAGKTSLVHAGLFPRLRAMMWECVWTRPLGANQRDAIRDLIWRAALEGPVKNECKLWEVMKAAAEKCRPRNLLIVMDQFEDVLKSPPIVMEELAKDLVTVQARSVIPNLRVLVSFREDSFVRLSTRLLKTITGSAQQFPSVELERLSRDGARQAFLIGLENARIGLDPRQDVGQEPFIEIILDDIQQTDDRLYPPYLQMVAETLCATVEKDNPIISREKYHEMGGANEIISRYLIQRLEEFGNQKDKARKVLIFLTSSQGGKAQKTLEELCKATEIGADGLKEILAKMIDMRMARTIGSEEYEIIHDHLGHLVDTELVDKEDRELKFLQEQLEAAQRLYEVHQEPIQSTTMWANLYRNRGRVVIGEDKQLLLLCSFFWNVAGATTRMFRELGWWLPIGHMGQSRRCGWFWLRNIPRTILLALAAQLLKHNQTMIGSSAAQLIVSLAIRDHPPLVTDLLKDNDSQVRRTAVQTMGHIGARDDLQSVHDLLKDSAPDVRQAAVEAFGKLGARDDLPLITDMLKDNDSKVRQAAVEAFGKLGTRDDLQSVRDMLKDSASEVRQAAVEAFGNIGTHDDLPLIADILKNEGYYLVRHAVEAFGKLVTRDDLPLITDMLKDDGPKVRQAAVEAFGRLVTGDDLPLITDMLKDSASDLRQAAVQAIGNIGTHDDLPLITDMLKDSASKVRQAAVVAIGNIGTHDDLPLITDMLKDSASEVRQAVVVAIGNIGTHDDLPLITDVLMGHASDVFPAAAVEAIGNVRTHDDLPLTFVEAASEVLQAAVEPFAKLATHDDLPIVIDMLKGEFEYAREAAVEALEGIATDIDAEALLDLLAEKSQGGGAIAAAYYEALCRLDCKFYCPIPAADYSKTRE